MQYMYFLKVFFLSKSFSSRTADDMYKKLGERERDRQVTKTASSTLRAQTETTALFVPISLFLIL